MRSSPPVRRCAALLASAALVLLPGVPAAAQQPDPAARFPVGSPAMAAAQQIAVQHWGTNPCGGVVDVRWGALDQSYNAVSTWTNDTDAYAAPAGNYDCRIDLNRTVPFAWDKLCTIVVHEYGHLVGHAHDAEEGHLMSAIYTTPLPECVAARARVTGRAARPRTSRARRPVRR